MAFAVKFDHLFQHHGARWHINTQSKGLRGKHRADKTFNKELFHNVPKRWKHTRVVGCETAHQCSTPLLKVQYLKVFLGDSHHAGVDNACNLF